MLQDKDNNQQQDCRCQRCGSRFPDLGDFAKHLLTAHPGSYGGGGLSPEEIDRICYGPL
jgi:uncharacterized C2H2 Zn-finger protein